jgi:formamidopyrimidine-DNA glycosylase
MPELPEVETIVRSLEPRIRGRVIARAELLFKPLLRRPERDGLKGVVSRRVLRVRRRGKMIVIELEGGRSMVFHLKMTGQLLLVRPGGPRDKHTRLVIAFRDAGDELRFRDVRKFGFLLALCGGRPEACDEIAALGPEPLEISKPGFARLFEGRKGRIKGLLLDQRIVAGIGNIYADEILFDAGIHPATPAFALRRRDFERLWVSTRKVLTRAIKAKGSSLSDYVDAEGRAGSFQLEHKVYDREGERCVRCEGRVRRIQVAGRSSYFCPRCQRLRRSARPPAVRRSRAGRGRPRNH